MARSLGRSGGSPRDDTAGARRPCHSLAGGQACRRIAHRDGEKISRRAGALHGRSTDQRGTCHPSGSRHRRQDQSGLHHGRRHPRQPAIQLLVGCGSGGHPLAGALERNGPDPHRRVSQNPNDQRAGGAHRECRHSTVNPWKVHMDIDRQRFEDLFVELMRRPSTNERKK